MADNRPFTQRAPEWCIALIEAKNGDRDKLVALLRSEEPIPVEVREFIAEWIEASRTNPFLPQKRPASSFRQWKKIEAARLIHFMMTEYGFTFDQATKDIGPKFGFTSGYAGKLYRAWKRGELTSPLPETEIKITND